MILEILNRPSKISDEMLDSIVNHADRFLDLEELEELQIVFKGENGDTCGYFDGIGEEEDGVAVIEINSKKSLEEIIKTIFHEIVHVQQVLHGFFCNDEKTWHGDYFGDLDYDEKPWEIDAFSKEGMLYSSWKTCA
jgi:hypothetical protein|tara:strand:- start:1592 stop:1999 length:408 start_codon:yes stop_codon:yes gene_type:complete